MKRTVLAFLFLVAAPIFAWSAEGDRQTVRYTLDNGLQVVLAPDRHVPKVVMNVRYRVGSMNEPAGRSGFAHLFEHLMFSGTKAWPSVFGAHSAVGDTINAWTQEDGTVYYVEGLSANLPLILSIEADRMANLGGNVDQRKLDLQRNVVKNEMRQNVLDSAGAAGWDAFWSGLWTKAHPYSRAVIGSIADLDQATLDDVRGFFNTYYVPNNAILVLVGDFDVEDAKALVQDTFGRVPRQADVPRPMIPAPSATHARIEVTDKVATPTVAIGFSGPAATDASNGDLAIFSELLGNGSYGFLRNRLVSEKGIANSVGASWTPGLLGGRFEIDAAANDGVSAETLEKELRAAFEEFLAKPIDPADVARAKSSSLLSAKLSIEPLEARTSSIAFAADVLNDPGLALKDDPQIVAATAESIAATARRLLKPEEASTLVIRPGPRGNYPAVLLDSSGVPTPFAKETRATIDIPKLAQREPGTAKLPEKSEAVLSNGIKVIHYQLPNSPMEYVSAISKGGWDNCPEGKEGLIDIATNMSIRGAGDKPYAEFAKAAADIGASIGYSSSGMGTAIAVGAPKAEIGKGLDMLADVVLRPRFDQAEWKIVTVDYAQWLANRDSDLSGLAARAANKILWPKVPGKPDQDWSPEALKAMSLDDARQAFHHLYQPDNTTFYSVGSQPIGDVVAALETRFGSWKGDGPGLVAEEMASPQFASKRKVVLVPDPGASQSALYIARPAPGRDDPDRAVATAVMRLLGDDFNGRLNSVIREEKGYTYGVSGRLMSGTRSNGGMVIEMTVERDNTGAALQEVFKGFETLNTLPVSDEELNRTITAYLTAIAATAETGSSFAGYIVDTATLGSSLEIDHARREKVASLTLAPVREEAPKLASLDPSLIVVAGDPDIVLPQLAAIGITDVEVVKRDIPDDAATRDADQMLADPAAGAAAAPAQKPSSTPGVQDCSGQACATPGTVN